MVWCVHINSACSKIEFAGKVNGHGGGGKVDMLQRIQHLLINVRNENGANLESEFWKKMHEIQGPLRDLVKYVRY